MGICSEGRDGVVAYPSAHVDYVESELVVRGPHSCQNLPATIEEVRRILHEHLEELPPGTLPPPDSLRSQTQAASSQPETRRGITQEIRMKVIIVGGVAGGASCAARLRRLDEKAKIIMVERGPNVSCANCGLP